MGGEWWRNDTSMQVIAHIYPALQRKKQEVVASCVVKLCYNLSGRVWEVAVLEEFAPHAVYLPINQGL